MLKRAAKRGRARLTAHAFVLTTSEADVSVLFPLSFTFAATKLTLFRENS